MTQFLRQSTAATVLVGPFVDKTDAVTPETGLAVGTVDEIGIYKHDATALTSISGTTTFTHRAGGMYTLTLSTSDTGTRGRLTTYVRDDDVALPVWKEFTVLSASVYDSLIGTGDWAGMSDAVWDENMSGHNVKNSAAKFLKQGGGGTQVTLITGTAVAAGSSSITLDSDAVAQADIYNGNLIVITGGTGAGQTRRIIDYTAARVATVDLAWVSTPNATSTYELVAAPTSYLADEGTVAAADATSVTLASTAPAGDDTLNNALITITGGTGSGQTRVITDYNGTSKVATVAAWSVTPDTTSTYAVMPAAVQAPDSGGGTTAPTTSEIASAVKERLNDLSAADAQATSIAALTAYDVATVADVSGSGVSDVNVTEWNGQPVAPLRNMTCWHKD